MTWLKSWLNLPQTIAAGFASIAAGFASILDEQQKTNALLAAIAAQSADSDSNAKALNALLMRISCLTH